MRRAHAQALRHLPGPDDRGKGTSNQSRRGGRHVHSADTLHTPLATASAVRVRRRRREGAHAPC